MTHASQISSHKLSILILICVLFSFCREANAGEVIVAVNTVGVDRTNERQQDAFVEQLRQTGGTTVRLGMDEKVTHFITRAYQRGIGAVVIVYPTWGSEKTARFRPSIPWAGLI